MKKATTLEHLEGIEATERSGIWMPWDEMEGVELLIGHQENAKLKIELLMDKYRRDHRVPVGSILSPEAAHGLMIGGWFGTVVLGWRGGSLDALPFNEENYLRLARLRRFQEFVYSRSVDSAAFLRAYWSEVGEDSPAASSGS